MHLDRQIENGILAAGVRLSSLRDAARYHGVSRYTVAEAYERLVARGVVSVRPGSGFFVAGRRPRPAAASAPDSPVDADWLMRQQSSGLGGKARFGAALLPEHWFPDQDFRVAIRGILRDGRVSLAGYGDPQGYAPLRAQIALMLGELGIGARQDQVCTTVGASHGLELSMRFLLRPGDVALVDDPGFYNLFSLLKAYGVTIAGVPRGADGPDIGELKRLLARHRPKAFFTQSVLHNPTGGCTGPGTAYAILRLAEAHDFMIVEDDVYGDFDARRHPRIATIDQLNRVLFVGGFSKTLSASIRVGYLAAHPQVISGIVSSKLNGIIGCPDFTEKIVYSFLSGKSYRKHVLRLRERLITCRETAIRNLGELGFVDIFHPDGGYYLWARHPLIQNASHIARQAVAAGILLAPGEIFTVNGAPSSWFRFNAGYFSDPGQLALLKQLIDNPVQRHAGSRASAGFAG